MSGISPPAYRFHRDTGPLQSGRYWVIDPCYILGQDPFWSDLCLYSYRLDESDFGAAPFRIDLDSQEVYVFQTRWGDGLYPVTDGKTQGNAPVDSGMLCLVPESIVTGMGLDSCLGVSVELARSSLPVYEDGDLRCGNVTVFTSGSDEECRLVEQVEDPEAEYEGIYTVVGIDDGHLIDYGDAREASWVEIVRADRPSRAAIRAKWRRVEATRTSVGRDEDLAYLKTQTILAVFPGALQDGYEPVVENMLQPCQ